MRALSVVGIVGLLIMGRSAAVAGPLDFKQVKLKQVVQSVTSGKVRMKVPLRSQFVLPYGGQRIAVDAGRGNVCTLNIDGSPLRCSSTLSFQKALVIKSDALMKVMDLAQQGRGIKGWVARKVLKTTGASYSLRSLSIATKQQADGSFKASISCKGSCGVLPMDKTFDVNLGAGVGGKVGQDPLALLRSVVDIHGASGTVSTQIKPSKLGMPQLKMSHKPMDLNLEIHNGAIKTRVNPSTLGLKAFQGMGPIDVEIKDGKLRYSGTMAFPKL